MAVSVWNDVRAAADCPAIDEFRQDLHDEALATGQPTAEAEEPRGESEEGRGRRRPGRPGGPAGVPGELRQLGHLRLVQPGGPVIPCLRKAARTPRGAPRARPSHAVPKGERPGRRCVRPPVRDPPAVVPASRLTPQRTHGSRPGHRHREHPGALARGRRRDQRCRREHRGGHVHRARRAGRAAHPRPARRGRQAFAGDLPPRGHPRARGRRGRRRGPSRRAGRPDAQDRPGRRRPRSRLRRHARIAWSSVRPTSPRSGPRWTPRPEPAVTTVRRRGHSPRRAAGTWSGGAEAALSGKSNTAIIICIG